MSKNRRSIAWNGAVCGLQSHGRFYPMYAKPKWSTVTFNCCSRYTFGPSMSSSKPDTSFAYCNALKSFFVFSELLFLGHLHCGAEKESYGSTFPYIKTIWVHHQLRHLGTDIVRARETNVQLTVILLFINYSTYKYLRFMRQIV